MENESLIMQGGALKAAGLVKIEGKVFGKVRGYGVIHGSAAQTDLVGDWFTKHTYLGSRAGDGAEHVLHHAIPIKGFEHLRFRRFAPWKVVARDDYGVLVESLYDMSDDYERQLYGAVMAGKMGLSSGAVSHLVEYADGGNSGEIKTWIIGEISPTPCPCEPRTKEHFQAVKAMNLKALVEVGPNAFDVPQEVADELAALQAQAATALSVAENLAASEFDARRRLDIQRQLVALQLDVLSL
jgi:hypothetical protein